MKPPASVLAILCCVVVGGCDPGKADGAAAGCEPGTTDAGSDSGSDVAVPIAIDCSFSFAGMRNDVSYPVADERTDTAVGGKLIASGMLSDSEYEGRSFSMTVYAEDSSVGTTTLYQMDRTRLPHNEFHGDHGFTGLVWVTDPDAQETLQFACFARDPADPPHAWEE